MWNALLGLAICGSVLLLAVIVCLSLPQSKLRDFLMPIAYWGVVILCGIYVVSPVDFLPEIALGPFGFFDDAAAIAAGFFSARSALTARPSRN